MSLCGVTGHACVCQPEEGMFCPAHKDAIAAAVAAEREACAELCDLQDECNPKYIAAAIRARKP